LKTTKIGETENDKNAISFPVYFIPLFPFYHCLLNKTKEKNTKGLALGLHVTRHELFVIASIYNTTPKNAPVQLNQHLMSSPLQFPVGTRKDVP